MNRSNNLNPEFSFTLPKGVFDDKNRLHRKGIMRLATAKDELCVYREPSVQSNSAYGFLLLLSRVILRLGSLSSVSLAMLEQLTIRDLAYLREFYNLINQHETAHVPAECPHCRTQFEVELDLMGES